MRAIVLAAVVGLVGAGGGGRTARADAVLDWNEIALRTTAAAPFDPPRETRSLAIAHAAMFDAVNAIVGEFEPYARLPAVPGSASPVAAAAAAAHHVLVELYPAQKAALDAALARSLAAVPAGEGRAAGVAAGEMVARHHLSLRAGDGAERAGGQEPAGERPGKAGRWTPTPPKLAAALDPHWGAVRPFLLRSASQFPSEAAPALKSARYTRDFAEMKAIGSATSATRTQAQTDLARFWVSTAPQNWNPLARRLAADRHMTLSESARALALLNLACADAVIASWRVKFAQWQWRPVSAIRRADEDGNPATAPDPDWTPLLVTPPFPDYIAGHTAYAGAATAVLEAVFGRRPGVRLAMTSASAPGVELTYATFEEISQGVVDARVWGGVHWRTSSVRGAEIGRKIGRHAVQRFAAPVRRGKRASAARPRGS